MKIFLKILKFLLKFNKKEPYTNKSFRSAFIQLIEKHGIQFKSFLYEVS